MRRFAESAALALLLASCSGSSGGGTTPVPVVINTVELSQSTATLGPGETVQLTATAKDASGETITGDTVTWSSSAATIASVNSTGLVTGAAAGTATITASAGGKSASATVTVKLPVASIALSTSAATLVPGATVQITATALDNLGGTVAGVAITWSTQAVPVATVTNGLVTAVSLGTATIVASGGGKTASAIITVQNGAVIGLAGGTVISADNKLAVVIPAGALARPTSISILPAVGAPANALAISTAYDLEPGGLQFTQPVTLNFKYAAGQVPTGHSPALFQARVVTGGTWTLLPGTTVDTVAQIATVTTTHFSFYILQEPPVAIGVRNLDNAQLSTPVTGPVTVCVGETARFRILYYAGGGNPFMPTMSSTGVGSSRPDYPGPNIDVSESIFSTDPATGTFTYSVNGESATLVVNFVTSVPPCPPAAAVATRDVSGADNVQLYQNGTLTQLTTDNTSRVPSLNKGALGAAFSWQGGIGYNTGPGGGGTGGPASLRGTAWPVYFTSNTIDGINWVSPTQIQFSELTVATNLAKLFRINLDGTGLAPFGPNTVGATYREPFLAGNGLTYFAYAPPPGNAPTQLYSLDAAGGNLRQVLSVTGWAAFPSVSQDGQFVALTVYDPGLTNAVISLYDLNTPTNAPIQVSPANGIAVRPTICANGIVYYSYSSNGFNPWALFRWDMVSRTSTPVTIFGTGSFPQGLSMQPQSGIGHQVCP